MWQANKTGIIVLLAGLILLGGVHYVLTPHNEQLADQVLALGFCLLLFGVGLASWLSVKQPQGDEPADDDTPEEGDHSDSSQP